MKRSPRFWLSLETEQSRSLTFRDDTLLSLPTLSDRILSYVQRKSDKAGTRLRRNTISQHVIDMGYTFLFLVLQATHFFLPLLPHGLFAAFLDL